MSFLDQASTTKAIPVTVLLPGFQARAALTVLGVLQTFVNDDQKGVFVLRQVALHGLEVGNPASSMELDSLFVPKDRCQVMAFDTTFPQEQVGLMPRVERMVAYTSHYAIEAEFHMGTDALPADLLDSARVMFLGVTNATFFPLFRSQAAVIQHAPLAFIYRRAVQMYHPA
jgi:hypothetical protein